MSSLVGFLEEIEKLAYKLLLWVILIPKTIAKIIIQPRWAAGYIRKELTKDAESPFDEYISPIILLLGVALLPAVFVNFLPRFGTTVLNPVDGFIEGRVVQVEVESVFRSFSYNVYNQFDWAVAKIETDEVGSTFITVYDEFHSDYDGTASFIYVDENKIRDTFAIEFTEPGEYYIGLTASKLDPENLTLPIETQYAAVSVFVPENPEEQVYVSKSDGTAFTSNSVYARFGPQLNDDRPVTEFVADRLTDESTILLALALLLPPLLFALATKLFTEHAVSENTLRESFYAQCYYFSPLSLAIWGTYYANYFVTTDIFFYGGDRISQLVLFIPLGLASLWFMVAEINAIMLERETTLGASLFIVLGCILIIVYSGDFFLNFTGKREVFRVGSIWAYPLLTVLALAGFILARIRKRIRRR